MKWLWPFQQERRTPSPGSVKTRTLRVESLERRELLAVGVTLSFSRGTATLTVNDNGANEVSVARLPSGAYNFTSDGVSRQTAAWQTVSQIVITTKGGDDSIAIEPSVAVKVTVKADGGNDWICGNGSGQLVAYGGTGNDFIRQNGTGVLLAYGDGGDDTIIGGPNNDVIYCGAGNDIAKGQGGNDRIYGQSGFDTMYGGSGFDFEDGGCYGVDVYYVIPGEDTWKLDNQRNIHDIVHRFDPTSVTQPWTLTNGVLCVDWHTQLVGANINATGPTTIDIDWNNQTYTLTGVLQFQFIGGPYADYVNMALLAGPSTVQGNGAADTMILQNGHFNDAFTDYSPAQGDSLTGDGGTITTADEQFGTDSWLLRGNTIVVTLSSYVDPLGRIPLNVAIDGVDRGLHLLWSNLRIEAPSLASITLGPGVSAALADHFFSLSELEVAGALNPLAC